MAVRDIRLWGDPVLRTACEPVTDFDLAAPLVEDLIDTVTAAPGRAGLAANQIGVGLRVFTYFVDADVGYVINPTIERSEGEQQGEEGCLSLPGLWFPLTRAAHVVVSGVDLAQRQVRLEGTGLLARCFEHEMGHLSGELYIDRLTGDTRRAALRAARSN
jgi:peptide deformylase